jgi:hypothetical protein
VPKSYGRNVLRGQAARRKRVLAIFGRFFSRISDGCNGPESNFWSLEEYHDVEMTRKIADELFLQRGTRFACRMHA